MKQSTLHKSNLALSHLHIRHYFCLRGAILFRPRLNLPDYIRSFGTNAAVTTDVVAASTWFILCRRDHAAVITRSEVGQLHRLNIN